MWVRKRRVVVLKVEVRLLKMLWNIPEVQVIIPQQWRKMPERIGEVFKSKRRVRKKKRRVMKAQVIVIEEQRMIAKTQAKLPKSQAAILKSQVYWPIYVTLNQPRASPAAPASDPASEPTPTVLTPEQTEAETHRVTFLSKEVSRLEASKVGSDEKNMHEIGARVDVSKERIARTIFAGASILHVLLFP